MRQTDIAYGSGFFDGEGAIVLSIQKQKYLRVEVSVSQKLPEVLLWYQQHFGGKIYQSKGYVAQWKIHGAKAIEFLRVIYPYLITKAVDAQEAFDIWEVRHDRQALSRRIADRKERRASA
jgi:hypothetical protein